MKGLGLAALALGWGFLGGYHAADWGLSSLAMHVGVSALLAFSIFANWPEQF